MHSEMCWSHALAHLKCGNTKSSSSLQTGQYGKDIEMDFVTDAAADAQADWRNTFVDCLGKPDTDETVITYKETRCKFYNTMEWYYGQKSDSDSPYLAGGTLRDAFPSPGFLLVYL
jgi:hypothetical protein